MTEDSQKRDYMRVNLKSKDDLYSAYMPFIKEGAIFIQSTKPHTLGDNVSVALTLMEEVDQYFLNGEVVWITPVGAQANLIAGIGVKFEGPENTKLQNKITAYLAGMEKSDKKTDTL